MLHDAPRRPALLPAVFFLATAWLEPSPLLLTAAATALLWAARAGMLRSIDAALLVVAMALGSFATLEASTRRVEALGSAALALPIGAPFERSWIGTLAARPHRIDRLGWLLVLDARPEGLARPGPSVRLRLEFPTPREEERTRLRLMSPGQRVRVWARLMIDPQADLPASGAFAAGRIKSSLLIEGLDTSGPSARHVAQRVRDRLEDRLVGLYGPDEERLAFLSAVLLGQRTARPADLQDRLRASGLAHLLAISGLHVGMVAGMLASASRRVCRRTWCRIVATGGSLIAFGTIVGPSVPVLRAVSATVLLLLGQALGREGDPLNRLACLAVALGFCHPAALSTPAFALSFAASGGILSALQRQGPADPKSRAIAPLRVSCAAYLATAPFSAMHFGQLAPWAIVANLLAAPLLFLLLAAGYASLILADIPLVSEVAVGLTRAGYAGIEATASLIDRLPCSPVFVARIEPETCALTTALALAGWLLPSRPGRLAARFSFALAIVWIHVGPPPVVTPTPVALLLDVGQGQSLLWHDQRGTTLIDAGGRGYGRWDPGAAVVRPALLDRGIRRLDRLLLSHGHADHAGGALALIEGLEVGEVWLGPGWWGDRSLAEIAAAGRRRGTAVRLVSRGASFPGMRVLGPRRIDDGTTGNARSLVALLGEGPRTLFVPGDLDGPALDRFLADGEIPTAAALVLAHHGSRRGTPEELLAVLRPRVAVVSCGRGNRFGHPDPSVVRRLGERGVPLWRTDHHGTIRLEGHTGGWIVEAEY